MKNLIIILLLLSSSIYGQKVILTPNGVSVHPVAVYYNTLQTFKGGCPSGMIGDSVSSVVIDRTYVSYLSQADADNIAYKAAKDGVLELLDCGYPSKTGLYSHPNPTSDVVYFSQVGDAEVYDNLGKLLSVKKSVNSLSLYNLPNGVYNIKFKNSRGTAINIQQIKISQ